MKPVVLILCTGNSCRSQMAEGFLRKYAGDRYEIHSAGTEPAEHVNPLAVQVMAEMGIDISDQQPKHLRDFLGRAPVRHLLIVCDKANGSCPRIWPGALTRDYMPFDDPATFEGSPEETLAEFRRVRDLIGDAMIHWEPQPVGGTVIREGGRV
jgi:arsenate reductase (thioredoxin)